MGAVGLRSVEKVAKAKLHAWKYPGSQGTWSSYRVQSIDIFFILFAFVSRSDEPHTLDMNSSLLLRAVAPARVVAQCNLHGRTKLQECLSGKARLHTAAFNGNCRETHAEKEKRRVPRSSRVSNPLVSPGKVDVLTFFLLGLVVPQYELFVAKRPLPSAWGEQDCICRGDQESLLRAC